MIWEFAISVEPRVVEVRFSRDFNSKKHDFVAQFPSILHACHDSRTVALKAGFPISQYFSAYVSLLISV
jgi:hypothetical protein